jgi:hypothetical protein
VRILDTDTDTDTGTGPAPDTGAEADAVGDADAKVVERDDVTPALDEPTTITTVEDLATRDAFEDD